MEKDFLLYDSGVSEVAEGWSEEDWAAYEAWRHEHEYVTQDDGSCYCVICGQDGNA